MRTDINGIFLGLLLAAPAVFAGNGVFEINQAWVASGCFEGDDPGFPVRIVHSGSYRLTSNLELDASDGSAIVSQHADESFPDELDIALDLNGFTIRGPTVCDGDPLVCDPVGDPGDVNGGWGVLILALGQNQSALVTNGTVRGMPVAGVACEEGCVVDNVVATSNGLGGISVDGTIRNSVAQRNGGSGLSLANSGVIVDSVSNFNAGSGLFGGGTFANNAVDGNAEYGIFANPGATVRSNRVVSNADGVRCFNCLLLDNAIFSNAGHGIDFGNTPSGWGRNMILQNATSVINSGSAQEVDSNVCNPACP